MITGAKEIQQLNPSGRGTKHVDQSFIIRNILIKCAEKKLVPTIYTPSRQKTLVTKFR